MKWSFKFGRIAGLLTQSNIAESLMIRLAFQDSAERRKNRKREDANRCNRLPDSRLPLENYKTNLAKNPDYSAKKRS